MCIRDRDDTLVYEYGSNGVIRPVEEYLDNTEATPYFNKIEKETRDYMFTSVSYTHLDVYKRQAQLYPIYSYAVERVKKYHPVYAISGDVRFENQAVTDYCMKVLKIVNELDNGALTTLHIAPGEQPDDSLIYNPALKFYSYQSGHSLSLIHI